HVFLTTWVRRATEEESIAANGALVRNVLASGPRQAGVGLAHRPGPGARDRGRDRHDQAPPGRVPRIPADARLVPALVRQTAEKADHPRMMLDRPPRRLVTSC